MHRDSKPTKNERSFYDLQEMALMAIAHMTDKDASETNRLLGMGHPEDWAKKTRYTRREAAIMTRLYVDYVAKPRLEADEAERALGGRQLV